MKSPIRAEISAAALRNNLQRIRTVAPSSRVMAVVKANAYGHGLLASAKCLAEADAFGVARIEEALVLRNAGIATPIVLLEGVLDHQQLEEAARQDLDIVVHSDEQISLLAEAAPDTSFVVWLKFDTGMNRLGFRPEQLWSVLTRLARVGARLRELRAMTHFAAADEPDSQMTARQVASFASLMRGRSWPRSLCNSAALFTRPDAHAEWVRPGLALYGVSPFAELLGSQLGLQPAMRLVSTVIAVREVMQGETVGYGGLWKAAHNSRIAILAAGYGDGLCRSTASGTPVLIGGQRATIAGRVSMDMIAVDVSRLPPVQVGESAVLWGPELPVEEVAAHAATIPYELLCGITCRVPLSLV